MERLSISEMVEELIGSGMTGKAIAEIAGCDTSTISRIRHGQIIDPKHSVGVAIEDLHRKAIPGHTKTHPRRPHDL